MNTAKELYDRWLAQPELDTAVAEELHGIAGDDAAITDRFYRDLEFGTGGLRGVLGAGTNRMNLYTVRKATQGLADYLNATDLPKKIAIAHDSRNNGELFTREAARVLAANGITACVYPRLEPTPALSWAVRYLGCGAGVCITASHNPAKYNGYKVYGADGCQITLEVADKILAAIEKVDCFDGVKLVDYEAGVQAGRIVSIDDKCLDVAYENAALNGIGKDRYTVRVGDVLSDRSLRRELEGGYDIVVANIVADVIIRLSQDVGKYLAQDGIFITSGIIDTREQDVQDALAANGFTVIERRTSGGWVALACKAK